jgi:hypothetical protein
MTYAVRNPIVLSVSINQSLAMTTTAKQVTVNPIVKLLLLPGAVAPAIRSPFPSPGVPAGSALFDGTSDGGGSEDTGGLIYTGQVRTMGEGPSSPPVGREVSLGGVTVKVATVGGSDTPTEVDLGDGSFTDKAVERVVNETAVLVVLMPVNVLLGDTFSPLPQDLSKLCMPNELTMFWTLDSQFSYWAMKMV